jgi:hypothetical protein
MVFASDVAAATGNNQYKSQDELIQKYATGHTKEILQEVTLPSSIVDAITVVLQKEVNDVETLRSAGDEVESINLNVFTPSEVAAVEAGGTEVLDAKVTAGLITTEERNKIISGSTSVASYTLDSETQEKVKKELVSTLNTTFGTKKENAALQLYETQTGKIVLENNTKCYYLHYIKNDSHLFSICGKIDGLCDGKLVEIKNRKNRFFGERLPIYDKIQT